MVSVAMHTKHFFDLKSVWKSFLSFKEKKNATGYETAVLLLLTFSFM